MGTAAWLCWPVALLRRYCLRAIHNPQTIKQMKRTAQAIPISTAVVKKLLNVSLSLGVDVSLSLGADDSVSPGPDVFSGLTCVAPGGTYIMAADTMFDNSLTRPLLWMTFRANHRVDFKYSGRKRITNISVSDGAAGDVKFPFVRSLWSSFKLICLLSLWVPK